MASAINQSEFKFSELEKQACREVQQAGLTPDYIAICDSETLQPATPKDSNLVILAAAYIGSVRLIDNIRLSVKHLKLESRVIE